MSLFSISKFSVIIHTMDLKLGVVKPLNMNCWMFIVHWILMPFAKQIVVSSLRPVKKCCAFLPISVLKKIDYGKKRKKSISYYNQYTYHLPTDFCREWERGFVTEKVLQYFYSGRLTGAELLVLAYLNTIFNIWIWIITIWNLNTRHDLVHFGFKLISIWFQI